MLALGPQSRDFQQTRVAGNQMTTHDEVFDDQAVVDFSRDDAEIPVKVGGESAAEFSNDHKIQRVVTFCRRPDRTEARGIFLLEHQQRDREIHQARARN